LSKEGGQSKPTLFYTGEEEIMLLNFKDIKSCFKFLEFSFRLGRNLSSKHPFLRDESEGFPTSGNDNQWSTVHYA
jgi:hypothetical protein